MYCTSLFGVAPEEHPALLTENMFNPPQVREWMVQLMFETFRTPALYLVTPPVLALLATEVTTGLVVDSGVHAADVVPVCRGHTTQGSMPFAVAGDVLTTNVRERFCYPWSNLTMAHRSKALDGHDAQARILGHEPGKVVELMAFVL